MILLYVGVSGYVWTDDLIEVLRGNDGRVRVSPLGGNVVKLSELEEGRGVWIALMTRDFGLEKICDF